MPRLLIIGAGGHGRSLAEAVTASGIHDLIGFIDDSALPNHQILGYTVWGNTQNLANYRAHADCAIVAIGNNQLREELSERLVSVGFKLITVIHPSAIVSPSAVIGQGCAIMAGAIIGTAAHLGNGVIVNCGAVIDHDAQVHDYAHLGVNTSMAGHTISGKKAWMQAGSALGFGVHLAAEQIVPPCVGLSSSRHI
jgi:sugar O-acyltransferase (sialic acid O-acetyltransferase NeuD family)